MGNVDGTVENTGYQKKKRVARSQRERVKASAYEETVAETLFPSSQNVSWAPKRKKIKYFFFLGSKKCFRFVQSQTEKKPRKPPSAAMFLQQCLLVCKNSWVDCLFSFYNKQMSELTHQPIVKYEEANISAVMHFISSHNRTGVISNPHAC